MFKHLMNLERSKLVESYIGLCLPNTQFLIRIFWVNIFNEMFRNLSSLFEMHVHYTNEMYAGTRFL